MRRWLVAAAAAAIATLVSANAAQGCIPAEPERGVYRYVGGSLVDQIARKADVIQIVRASKSAASKKPVERWLTGRPSREITFTVVETLKAPGGAAPGAFTADAYVAKKNEARERARMMPRMMDAIGDPIRLIRVMPPEERGRDCMAAERIVTINGQFIALRRRDGSLYSVDIQSQTALRADTNPPMREWPGNVISSLLPIEGEDDAWLISLKQAVRKGD